MLAIAPYLFCILLSGAVFVLWRRANGLAGADARLAQLQEEQERLRAQLPELDALRAALATSQRNEALALQKVEHADARIRDFEAVKTQFEQYAKSAALATGNELSNKLLQDHQRARQETHEQFRQFTQLATEQLTSKQQALADTLGKVQGQVDASKDQLAVLVRAMQNPIGAGAEGEIIMGNILQQHGFTPGQDYELQVHLAGEEGALRPDCVIYLPHQHAIIVDAKASQHIFALFRSEGTAEFDASFREIQSSMRAHAKALSGKSYQESLRKLKNRNEQPITRTTLVMFVPNDEIVTRLIHKDPNLMQFMREHDIILAGPVTLSGIFLTSRALIQEARQLDAQAEIAGLTAELMADLITALGYAEDVMKGVRSSASAYDKFAASLNKGVMARMKRLAQKGVRPAKNKQLPGALPRYDITRADEVLQGEAEEVPTLLALPKEDAA
ncbi:MAG: DNA recombination protein RmuC [Alphaproteobacteria bacterium]